MEEQNKQDNPSEESVPGDVDVASAEGQENVADEGNTGLTLEQINETTGRNYKTLDSALAGIKETVDFVGKAGQNQSKEAVDTNVLEELAKLRGTVEAGQFYTEKPEYKPYETLISKLGDNPSEVVESEEFKAVFEKAKAGEEALDAKSVLETNPRLGQQQDKVRESRDLVNEGLAEGNVNKIRQAETAAVDAVLDSLKT